MLILRENNMDDLVAFLEHKFRGTALVRKIDQNRVFLYDLACWNKQMEQGILQRFPMCEFATEFTEKSVSGQRIEITYHPTSLKAMFCTVLYLILVVIILNLIYCVK
jgi:hypothetical protein